MTELGIPGNQGNPGNQGDGEHGGQGGTGGAGGVGTPGPQGVQGPQGIQGERYSSWLTRNVVKAYLLLAVGMIVSLLLVGTVGTRQSHERQIRIDAIAEQARMNAAQAEKNRMFNLDLCRGLNESNETLRFLLDGAIRGRTPTSPPLSDAQRQLTIDTYRRLPSTDCETGVKTYFDPPFP